MISRWNFSILDHSLECQFIVDTFHPFGKSIGYHNFSIASSLGSSIPITTPGIRHIAIMLINIQKRMDHIPLLILIYQSKKRHRCTVSIPNGIVIIIIRSIREMRVFPRLIHRHQHRMVDARVEHPFLFFSSCDFYLPQFSIPGFS